MSELERLIQEHCPNGIEYKTLGDVTHKINIGINPRKFFKLNPPEPTGFYVTVRELNGLCGVKQYEKTDLIDDVAIEVIKKRADIQKGDLLFSNTGTVGKMALVLETPTNWGVNEGIYVIKPDFTQITSKFLYYFLMSTHAYKDYSKKFTGSTLKHVTQQALSEIKIPVPPIEIQSEIVRILDNFMEVSTELITNLERERMLRKKQYLEYRHALFTQSDCAKKTVLGEIVDICMCKRILKAQTDTTGDIPFYQNGTLGGEAKLFISNDLYQEYSKKYKFPEAGDVMLSTVGTVGKAIQYDGQPAYFQDSNIVWLKRKNEDVTNEYLYWFCVSMPWKLPERATLKHLHNYMIAETEIAIPSKKRQEYVITKFQELESAFKLIDMELTAEIEARQKQYEYYRDKLLTFKAVE